LKSQYKGEEAFIFTQVVVQREFTGEVGRVSLPARPRDSSQLYSIETGLGNYLASNLVGARKYSPRANA
jgi:hypothetical protein